uniref:PNP_UDP_1 domain-containing protein n=1 Tax=Echinostoma caproni TaxID=27848 RepID=A0A183AZ02_9TREM
LFGSPSDVLIEGTIEGIPCVVLARHGRNHSITPCNVNYRANIWALKKLGCTHVIASSACGGLQKYTRPGDFLILDQFYDRTFGRDQSFYAGRKPCLEGVMHVPMGQPFCEETRKVKSAHPCVHTRGSGLTINGPRFSSRCESKIHQSWGIDVVNMTLVPEVVLAREAGLSYANMSIVTDYDSWKTDVEQVCVLRSPSVVFLSCLLPVISLLSITDEILHSMCIGSGSYLFSLRPVLRKHYALNKSQYNNPYNRRRFIACKCTGYC